MIISSLLISLLLATSAFFLYNLDPGLLAVATLNRKTRRRLVRNIAHAKFEIANNCGLNF